MSMSQNKQFYQNHTAGVVQCEWSSDGRHVVVVINSNTVSTAFLECAHYSAFNHIQTLVFVWSKETGKDKYLTYKNLEQQCLKRQLRTVRVCACGVCVCPLNDSPCCWTPSALDRSLHWGVSYRARAFAICSFTNMLRKGWGHAGEGLGQGLSTGMYVRLLPQSRYFEFVRLAFQYFPL